MVVETTARAPSSSARVIGGIGGLGLGVEGCVGNPLGVAKPAGTSDPPGDVSKPRYRLIYRRHLMGQLVELLIIPTSRSIDNGV